MQRDELLLPIKFDWVQKLFARSQKTQVQVRCRYNEYAMFHQYSTK